MVLSAQTMQADEENETWIELAAATANLVRYLELSKQQEPSRERDAQREKGEQEKKEEEARYIERRLKEIAAFEERLRSGYRSRRKWN